MEQKENQIDYRKLLKKCMEAWIDAEGCCWDGTQEVDELSKEEIKVVDEIMKEIEGSIEKSGGNENWTLDRILDRE